MDFHPDYFSELKKYNCRHNKMNHELVAIQENHDFIKYLEIKEEVFKFLKEFINCNLNILLLVLI